MMKRIVFILIICFWVGRVLAIDHRIPAVQDSVRLDTVKKSLQAQSLQHLLERDSLPLMTLPVDAQMKMSPVYLPDSLIRDTLRYEYTKIKDFAYKAKWTKELYKMVFVNPHRGYLNVMRTQNSEERFKAYSGKVIHDISIVVLPPYGTSVYDTTYFEEDMGWLKNLANKTHMKTAEKVIRRQLTIKPGMLLVPFELVQNEILLRRLDYIDDANMIVTEDPDNPAQVNVTLICKDQLSWGATVESNFLNSFDIGLENKNFMKLGHVLNYEFSYRGTKDKKWGNELEYKVNSLWGTHINIRGYYRNDYREKEVFVDVERQFLTNRMKWAGTEDIPTGLMLSLTTGYEKSEFDNYGYIAGECHYSHFNKYDERYYALEAALGSYVNEDGFTRGTLKLGASHISNLCSWGSFKFRFYNDVHYVKGIRRYPGDFLYMEDRNIRGFSSDTLRGNQKLSSSLATTFFLPYIKKGFRVSISSFCDFGVIAADNKKLVHSKTYWGFGVGVNLRNDNVVIKNISFRFAVYPTIPEDGRSFQAILSSGNRGSFYDYHVTKPQVIQYE